MKRRISTWRDSSSGARRIEDGCTVASTRGASSDARILPRSCGLDHGQLRLQPGTAGHDLERVRLGVDAPLAARLPLEVLHDVGDVGPAPLDPGLLERLVEQASRRPDEGMAAEVFLVAGLLADEHGGGSAGALAEHGLGATLPQVAGLAVGGGGAQ